MELSTLIGIGLAWGALVGAMLVDGMSPATFFNIPAIILVIGGTAGATLASARMEQVKQFVSLLKQTTRPGDDNITLLNRMVDFATVARKQGILQLDRTLNEESDPFVRRALTLVIDGTEEAKIREALENDCAHLEERHKTGERFFTTAAGFAPTLGIIGTVVGLIHMLQNLADPSSIGPAIASAFMATLYGVSMANLFFLPVANKLRAQHNHESVSKELAMEGALGIARGESPSVLRDHLVAMLPPQQRAAYGSTRTAAEAPPAEPPVETLGQPGAQTS